MRRLCRSGRSCLVRVLVRYGGTNGPSVICGFSSASGVDFPKSKVTTVTTSSTGLRSVEDAVHIRAVKRSGMGRLHRMEFFKSVRKVMRRVGGRTSVLHPGFRAILRILRERLNKLRVKS